MIPFTRSAIQPGNRARDPFSKSRSYMEPPSKDAISVHLSNKNATCRESRRYLSPLRYPSWSFFSGSSTLFLNWRCIRWVKSSPEEGAISCTSAKLYSAKYLISYSSMISAFQNLCKDFHPAATNRQLYRYRRKSTRRAAEWHSPTEEKSMR